MWLRPVLQASRERRNLSRTRPIIREISDTECKGRRSVMKRFHLAGLTVLVIGVFIVTAGGTHAQCCQSFLCGAGGFQCCLFEQPPTIADRWRLTGGSDGPLGCAVSDAQAAPGGTGQVQPFQNGQIVNSPAQGTNMTVA